MKVYHLIIGKSSVSVFGFGEGNWTKITFKSCHRAKVLSYVQEALSWIERDKERIVTVAAVPPNLGVTQLFEEYVVFAQEPVVPESAFEKFLRTDEKEQK